MKTGQKILLTLSIIAYAIVLISFLTQNMWVLLASIIVSSSLLICFALSGSDNKNYAEKKESSASEENFFAVDEREDGEESSIEETQEDEESVSEKSEDEKTDDEAAGDEAADAEAAEDIKADDTEAVETEAANAEDEIELSLDFDDEIKIDEQETDFEIPLFAIDETILDASSEKETEEKNVLRDDITRNEKRESLEYAMWGLLPPAESDKSDREPIDVVEILRSTIAEFGSFADKAEVSIRLNASRESFWVKADKRRIRILFRNIIDNSIKYMNRAGALIVTVSNIDKELFIVFKDTGDGLSEDETVHVFELNFQGSNRISGNGLGLTQAKAIVDYYGGNIYAKSTEGNGMGIYIQLPGLINNI